MEKQFKLKEVATILGVSNDTLKRWESKGKLKCNRTLGNQRRISLSEVDRLIELMQGNN